MSTVCMRSYHGDFSSKESFIAQLLDLLKTTPLDRRFEEISGPETFAKNNIGLVTRGQFGYYHDKETGERGYYVKNLPPEVWHFSGNFFHYSFAYGVYTDEPELIETLRKATAENMQSAGYIEQGERTWKPIPVIVEGMINNFPDCLECAGNIIFR